MTKLLLRLICICLVCSSSGRLFAQKHKLKAELDTLYPATRSFAPSALLWKLTWEGSGLVEGRLELSLYNDDRDKESFSQIVIPDIVLNSDENRIRTNLPALNTWAYSSLLSIHARFISEDGTYDLGRHPLRISNRSSRALSMCICQHEYRDITPEEDKLLDTLHLETFNPVRPVSRNGSTISTVSTINTRIRPEDMPVNSLNYCSFDIVVLLNDDWNRMRSRQLKALNEWIQAGGSLLIIPSRQTSEDHSAFLNSLAASKGKSDSFYRNSSGHLMIDNVPKNDLLMLRLGWGRVVIATHKLALLPLKIDKPYWREAVVYLWKFRHEQYASCMSTNKWDEELALRRESISPQVRQQIRQIHHQPIAESSGMLTKLMPKDVRMFPLSLMAILLFGFVLAIGPGDYYLLGILRRRQLTWIVFPLVTIAFSMFVAWLIETYMGSHEKPNALVVVDFGENGQIVRENRFELNFAGRYQTIETQVRSGLLTPLSSHSFNVPNYYNQLSTMQQRQAFMLNQSNQIALSSEAAVYKGRYINRFSVTQELPQWTPRINRVFRINPESEKLDIPWDKLSPLRYRSDVEKEKLSDLCRMTFGPNVTVKIFHLGYFHTILGKPSLFPQSGSPYLSQQRYSMWKSSFLEQISVRKQHGFFSYVSQISPHGGANYEDLTILDPSDPQQWLLVVAMEKENEILVYRKLYYGDE